MANARKSRRDAPKQRDADRATTLAADRQAAALALGSALAPIVDLCIELGITSPEMERVLRGVFVDRAARILLANKKAEPSTSGIGLMIGVHRSIVREIRATKPQRRLEEVQQRHRADALLQAWATEWDYLTPAGLPRELPIQFSEGEPTLASLAARYLPGVALGTVMSELRRSGAIQLLPDEMVRLLSRKTRHPGLTEASISTAGTHLADLAATLLHNLKGGDESWYCESSESLSAPKIRLPFLRQTIGKRAQNFLDSLSEELHVDASDNNAVPIGVTIFYHELPVTEPGRPVKKKRRSRS